MAKLAVALREYKELAEQHAATAEILRIVSASPRDSEAVFDAILKSAMRLCDAHLGLINTWNGTTYRTVAQRGAKGAFAKWLFDRGEVKPLSYSGPTRMLRDKRPVQYEDLGATEAYRKGSPPAVKFVKEGGVRTYLAVPLLKGPDVIGFVVLYRPEVRPFTQRQIGLLQTFADHAVIAIENARMFNETKEALERQTATSELLKVIGQATSDLQPVFDTLAENAVKVCRAGQAFIFRFDGRFLRVVASCNISPELRRFFADNPIAPGGGTVAGRTAAEGRTIHVHDVQADPQYGWTAHRVDRIRTVLTVPMIRGGELLGVIGVNRPEVRPFSEHEIELLQSFASQAVIAIENVRLFTELRARNDDLRISLEQQTATSDLLKVIGRSTFEVRPVFETLAQNAVRLCEAERAVILRFDGQLLRFAAGHNVSPELRAYFEANPIPPGRNSNAGRAALERRTIHNRDVLSDPEYTYGGYRVDPYRTVLAVPMLKADEVLGVILIYRHEVRLFSDSHIALMETFADQAVIAIENVRLFNETKEALEQQTATAGILRVISSSPTATQPVFEAIVQSAARLFEPCRAVLVMREGDLLQRKARAGPTDQVDQAALATIWPLPFDPERSIAARCIVERRIIEIPDAEAPGFPAVVGRLAKAAGYRSITTVPLLREGEGIGLIALHHPAPGYKLTDKQLALVRTFADQAVIAIENVRLFNETKEALERQTATAEILKVISASPSDVQPVFDAIVRNAAALCGGMFANAMRFDGTLLHFLSTSHTKAEFRDLVQRSYPRLPDDTQIAGRAVLAKAPVVMEDALSDPTYERRIAEIGNWRRMLGVPLLREGRVLGVIVVGWAEAGPVSKHHEALLKTFADQAAIAIENVRLFNETREALERQTATAEILRVIASSPSNVQPVFEAIVQSAVRLCGARFGRVYRYGGSVIEMVASHGLGAALGQVQRIFPRPAADDTIVGRVILTRQPFFIKDIALDDRVPELSRQMMDAIGTRSQVTIPMLRAGEPIGVITMGWDEPGAFNDQQVALLKTFADQAVIAVENARLFNETKEALEQLTATAEILKVISSSPTDVQPVLDAVAESAARLCESEDAVIRRVDPDGLRRVAHFGPLPTSAATDVHPIVPGSLGGRAVLEGRAVHVEDMEEEFRNGRYPDARMLQAESRYRTLLAMPLLRDKTAIGVILIRRKEVRRFSDKQIALLKTFADQAVIAIENVRLFKETKEALEQQTATAEILRVISGSPTDIQPVLDAVASTAARLCGATDAVIRRVDGKLLHLAAKHGAILADSQPRPIDRSSAAGRAVLERRTIHISNVLEDAELTFSVYMAQRHGFRAILATPLLREGQPIGTISIRRQEARLFSDSEVKLLETFASQAVIAIENVRLFKELQERTEALTKSVGQLTALGEVGQTISSTLDLETVLSTIVSHARRLSGLDGGVIYEYEEHGEVFHLRASENLDEEIVAAQRRTPVRKGEGAVGQAGVTREPTQVSDIRDASYQGRLRELLLRAGHRAVLALPLLREGRVLGALAVTRKSPGAFAAEVVEVLKTFAGQSALAIQNARLFREIAQKGKELEVASHHKSQFLASMSHELRTPLNALLGFNEMILGDIYGEVPADMRPPLGQMQASGKHLLRLINNVLDLAKIEAGRMELALADYSVQDTVEGVRSTLRPLAAEKGLELLAAVPADIPLAYGDAGRIAQCLMNLAGNSLKFTKAGKVEISVAMSDGQLRYRVADTGIGIPPDKIGSLFTEFKQTDATIASEYGGTGLGLSISKKFVEMHGGRIWVESEPGQGSVFTFEVPLRARAEAAAA